MKRKTTEVNVFSMSALDLFASALGAFILLAVIFMPFFPNTGDHPKISEAMRERLANAEARAAQLQQELNAQNTALEQSQQALEQSQQSLATCQSGLETCQKELDKTFLLVVISWSSEDDIDLHVTDPQGNEFYYEDRTHPGSEASFEEDNTRGPGNEIWLHPNSEPGKYEIHYKYFRQSSSSVTVRGNVLFQGGKFPLPTTTLTNENEKPLVTTITVDDEGNVTLG